MVQPFKEEVRMVMSATGSPISSFTLDSFILAPIILQTVSIPSLVGLIPTFFIVISEFGVRRPAAIKYAAEDISPGTWMCCAFSLEAGLTVAVVPSLLISTPKDSNINSV